MPTDSLEEMQALLMCVTDPRVDTDTIFLHGSSVKSSQLDDLILQCGADLLLKTFAVSIVVNGKPASECAQIAYAGVEVWLLSLLDLGVLQNQINTIAPSAHTAAECKAFIELSKERGWKSVTVVALPHHILRCMRTWVAVIRAAGIDLKVYAQTPHSVDWMMPAQKPVLDGPDIKGTYFDHIAREHAQGERFENKAGVDEKGKFTPHATLAELIEYMKTRDA